MWILEQYRKAGCFFREKLCKLFLVLCISFVGLSVLSGIALATYPDILHEFIQQIVTGFEEKGLFEEGGISFFHLFFNNVTASATSTILGGIPFFFLTVLPVLANALVLGAMGALYQTYGIGLEVFFVGILPHGILELPALLASFALGLYLCWVLTAKICGQRERSFFQALNQSARFYVLIVLPLLFVAAVNETYVTHALMKICFGP